MEGNLILPVEIWDRIWLLCDENTLINTRELQSRHVKKRTEYFSYRQAASSGNLENMRWLRKNRYRIDSDTFCKAVEHGNLENMRCLKEIGCPFRVHLFSTAARQGNLENMKWLRENNCKMQEGFGNLHMGGTDFGLNSIVHG